MSSAIDNVQSVGARSDGTVDNEAVAGATVVRPPHAFQRDLSTGQRLATDVDVIFTVTAKPRGTCAAVYLPSITTGVSSTKL